MKPAAKMLSLITFPGLFLWLRPGLSYLVQAILAPVDLLRNVQLGLGLVGCLRPDKQLPNLLGELLLQPAGILPAVITTSVVAH